MNDPRAVHFGIRLCISLAIPFLLGVSGVRLLLSEQFLQFEYRRPGFPADVYGFSVEDRLHYGAHAINYLFNAEPINYLAALRLAGEKCWNPAAGATDCALFSERELRHMADVKRTTAVAFALAAVCAVVGVAITFASRFNEGLRAHIVVAIRRGCNLTLLSVAFLAVLSRAAWDRAFDAFHGLFFAEGSWRFPFSDSLIRLYPEQLFIDAALLLAIYVSLCAVSLLCFLSLWDRRARRQI